MKVLVTADPLITVPPVLYGGIERVIASLIEAYRAEGHEVALVALPGSTVAVDAFYPWPMGPNDLSSLSSFWHNTLALTAAVCDFKPDVLHSFSRLAYLGPQLFTRLPKIMSYQREPSLRTTRWAARLAGDSLCFTGCSNQLANKGRPAGGEWHGIPNFVDLSRFDAVEHVPLDAPLVFLSRLERIKGVHNAIAIARASGRRLIIAGNRVESAEGQAYFETEIAPWLGRDGIEYIGPVDDAQKNRLLGSAAAMVVPIEWEEPFGIVFAEALACGTPVISTPLGAVPEIVRDGVEGLLLQDMSDGPVAVAALAQISRRACRARAEASFSLTEVAARYLALYRVRSGHSA